MANISSKDGNSCLSLWPLDMPQAHLITWAILTAILSPITVAANTLLIYSLHKTKQLVTITNKFILMMNISDLVTGIIVLPCFVVLILTTGGKQRHCIYEQCLQVTALFLGYFTFLMLICVSIDRYIHVTKLNQYNKYMNESRMKAIMLICGIMALAIPLICTLCPSFELQIFLNSFDLVGLLLMCILYARVFRKINIHTENFKKMLVNTDVARVNKETKRELSATKTIRILLLTLLVLYLPYNFASVFWTYYRFHKRVKPPLSLDVVEYFAYLIVFGNTAVNAIIFIMGNTTVKRFIVSKFGIPVTKIYSSETEPTQTNNIKATSKL